MIEFLYHYFDDSVGPFRNLSDLEPEEAERVLNDLRVQKRGFASNRSIDYLTIRRSLENKARELFIQKGGKPGGWLLSYLLAGKDPFFSEKGMREFKSLITLNGAPANNEKLQSLSCY